MVNAAGVFDEFLSDDTAPQLWPRLIDTNLTGSFNGHKAAADVLLAHRSGRINNIGSIAAPGSSLDGLVYAMSKAAMLGLTRCLALDVARTGITANVICPGAVWIRIRKNSEEILGDMGPEPVGASPSCLTC